MLFNVAGIVCDQLEVVQDEAFYILTLEQFIINLRFLKLFILVLQILHCDIFTSSEPLYCAILGAQKDDCICCSTNSVTPFIICLGFGLLFKTR